MREPVLIRLPTVARGFQVVFMCGWVGFAVKAYLDFGQPVILLFSLVGVAFAARNTSLMVRADSSGLFVRNLWRTRSIPWSQVERFGFGAPSQSLGLEKVVHVVLRDGEVLSLDATRRSGRGERMREQVRRLQAWLDY